MTGFGFAESESDGQQISAEIKSLNARFLDIYLSLPSSLSALEEQIRGLLKQSFARGRLEVSLKIRDTRISADRDSALAWKSALEELSEILGTREAVSLDLLTRQDGMFRSGGGSAEWAAVEPMLRRCIDQIRQMREREGEQLTRDIRRLADCVEQSLEIIREQIPVIRQETEEALRTRFRDIIGDEASEQRILQETAAWIIKNDINEEVVRLDSHIAAFRNTVSARRPVGKKLDFLAQEMGREINTIGSKIQRTGVIHQVVEMKDAMEQIREQLRNVE